MKVEKIYIKVPNSYPGKGENFRNLWSAWRGEMIVLPCNEKRDWTRSGRLNFSVENLALLYNDLRTVVPAKAGIQINKRDSGSRSGMTKYVI